jgi:hypothetical protein
LLRKESFHLGDTSAQVCVMATALSRWPHTLVSFLQPRFRRGFLFVLDAQRFLARQSGSRVVRIPPSAYETRPAHALAYTAGQLSRCRFSLPQESSRSIMPARRYGHADALGCEGVVLWNLTRNSKSSCRGYWLR